MKVGRLFMVSFVLSAAVVAWPPSESAAAEDDLAVVKRAVDEGGGERREAPARRGAEPQWLKVRILDKGQKKTRVSLNLPLGLVRAVGDSWVLDKGLCSRRGSDPGSHCMTLGEILRSLDAGQEIVQVEDETSVVRVFVE